MKNALFPINYLSSILTPTRTYLGRKQLSWPKMVVVILFLNGLMMIPISLNFAQSAAFTLEPTYPTIFEMVDDNVVEQLGETETSNGVTTFTEPFRLEQANGVVLGGASEADVATALSEENALVFQEESMLLKEADLPLTEIAYSENLNWQDSTSPEAVRETISYQWYLANKTYVVATYSIMITAMLLIMSLFMIFGGAFFIFMAARSPFIEIDTYKEAVNLILNAMGLPSLLTMVVGLFVPEITIMMSVQTFGVVIYLVWTYYKTRFSEGFLEREDKRAVAHGKRGVKETDKIEEIE